MTPLFSIGLRTGATCLVAAALSIGTHPLALAQQPAPPPAGAPAPGAPAAAEAAPAAPAGPTAMATPSMAGPLVANPDPWHLDVAPFFGPMYVTGAASVLGLTQTAPLPTDKSTTVDISNAQATLQTTSGWFQFLLEPGIYDLPVVGVPYKKVTDMPTATNLFGGLPIGWGKIQPTDNFSIQGGKLPTLIGAESMFTFQNMNIERGLLWNQEPVVSRGVQGNLTTGPVAWALSFNDGYYSGQYNWLSGSATWTIDPANSVIIAGGGALSRNTAVGPATPLPQNNSTIVEASYTYNAAPWTVTPYVQYTSVGTDKGLGLVSSSTIGGAVLASYAFTDHISLAGRWEYIGSSGAASVGGLGLLGYGPGSSAMSFTLTPTFQNGIFFLRGEGSVTTLSSIAVGAGFGFKGHDTTQGRFLVETGVVF